MADIDSTEFVEMERRRLLMERVKISTPKEINFILFDEIFSIMNFQRTQNHNSTEMRLRMDKLQKQNVYLLVLLLAHVIISSAPQAQSFIGFIINALKAWGL